MLKKSDSCIVLVGKEWEIEEIEDDVFSAEKTDEATEEVIQDFNEFEIVALKETLENNL